LDGAGVKKVGVRDQGSEIRDQVGDGPKVRGYMFPMDPVAADL
jgi:hypothetical protein